MPLIRTGSRKRSKNILACFEKSLPMNVRKSDLDGLEVVVVLDLVLETLVGYDVEIFGACMANF